MIYLALAYIAGGLFFAGVHVGVMNAALEARRINRSEVCYFGTVLVFVSWPILPFVIAKRGWIGQ